jgi:hypothetical protein
MRPALSFILLLLLITGTLCAQYGILPDTLRVKQGVKLPCALKETSGLALYDGLIWSFNDSGGKSVVYGMDPQSGKILRKIRVRRPNHDWESITASPEGLWIGDIGNNRGQRKDLQLFFLAGDQLKKSGKVSPKSTISVHHPEDDFPQIKGKGHNRDSEAIIFVRGNIYLFTKNRLNTDAYIAPISPDLPAQAIIPLDTLRAEMMVTAADYNETTDLLALSGYYAYRNYLAFIPLFTTQPNQFGRVIRYHLRGLDGAQIEALALTEENEITLSTEKTGLFPQQTFRLNAGRLALPTGVRPDVCLESAVEILSAYVDPANHSLHYRLNKAGKEIKAEVIGFRGKRYYRGKIGQTKEGVLRSAEFSQLPLDQPLFLRIEGDGVYFSHRIALP